MDSNFSDGCDPHVILDCCGQEAQDHKPDGTCFLPKHAFEAMEVDIGVGVQRSLECIQCGQVEDAIAHQVSNADE